MVAAARESKEVLIVEDELVVARNLKMIVEKLGYSVMGIASTGRRALELVESSDCLPQLVLMDITLKGPMDGIETARIIQDSCETPIMYITGNKDQGTINRAIETTLPVALLSKPFNVDTLRSLINDTLDPVSNNPDESTADNNRVSERLPVPANDNVQISVTGNGNEFSAKLKNLSMTGAGFISRDLIFSIENVVINIVPQHGWNEIEGICHVKHMSMISDQYYYGVELELDSDNHKNLASYYSYLISRWFKLN